ncbi:conserved hypothetical protein [Perkinsus marinus ATCC 50983]|uniref:Carbonyl reductase n=2 Tax=Perkinsus marinus (strain ATCC 50983 / TXsc) TaxID=423536 RepID=C5KR10_PERM5|nr:conserved hypothetical protein [Perkinsus marinus ATCC 50983]EER13084.1 conserved hypothetical protein [Perkinsus marinus ATCC 50983]|eukprot:XP_002781289.1 conserved hypothetical protein [Perkinsus marinus ATCC 50983]
MSPVIIVTGANKGIGYEISKKLIADGAKVIMTARDQARLDEAANKLKPFGAVKLDVTDDASVEEAKREISRLAPAIDGLVNNAGIAYSGDIFGYEEAKLTMAINYYGAKRVTKAFYPLLGEHGRIVNVCSFMGRLCQVSDSLQKRFADPNATEESIDALVEEFITGVKEGDYKERGFSNSMYGMSKLALIAYTKILAKKAMADSRKIVVTGCCPGWCQTDMSGHSGPRTAETGAQVMAWLAGEVEYDPEMSGKLYRDEKEFEWQTGNLLSTGKMY